LFGQILGQNHSPHDLEESSHEEEEGVGWLLFIQPTNYRSGLHKTLAAVNVS
jgi:hypothetical protein